MFSVQKKETLFSMYKKHFVVCAKERNNVLYAQKHTVDILLSVQRKEIMFSMDKKHFVVYAKERNTVFCAKERNTVLYAQEMLCCQCKRKKHCFLCTVNTLLSRQMK